MLICAAFAAGLLSYRVQNSRIAKAARVAAIENCESDNQTRRSVREIAFASGSPRLQQLALDLLAPRDCEALPDP